LGLGAPAVLAALIAWLAVPRLVSALFLLPGDAAIDLVEAGIRPSEAGIFRAIEAQGQSLRYLPQADPHLRTAYLALSLAESSSLPAAEESELIEVGKYHLVRALTLSPAQPRGWFMLAGLRLRAGDRPAAAEALSMSLLTNPHLPLLAPLRWPLALELGASLSKEERERSNLEFLSFLRFQPETALRIALREDRLAELKALAGDRGEDRDRLAGVLERLQFDRPGA
jgi:hypothetical protein